MFSSYWTDIVFTLGLFFKCNWQISEVRQKMKKMRSETRTSHWIFQTISEWEGWLMKDLLLMAGEPF